MTEGSLLQGVVDFHVHTYPSLMPRACDFVQLCYSAEKAGYRLIGHKDHNYSSAGLAWEIKKELFPNSSLEIVGTIAMNQSVGGMDPVVLENALAFGARAVWLPTTSARRHIEFTARINGFPQATSTPKTPVTPVDFLDQDGSLQPDFTRALEILKEHPGVAIGSGHGSVQEVDALVKKSVELGIGDRFFVDHPYGIIEAPLEKIIEWANTGVVIEFVAGMSLGKNPPITIDSMVEYIRAIGVDHCILLSDLGQKEIGDPIEAYGRFLMELYRRGISETDIRYMTSYLPGKMLGLDQL